MFSHPNSNKHYLKMQGYPDEFLNTSSVLAKKYAERTGADYVFLRDNPVINVNHPVNEKLQPLMPMWTEKYDQILYLDSDVFCWPEAPDLFEICPPGTFAITEKKHSGIKSVNKIKVCFDVDIGDLNVEGVSKDKFLTGIRDQIPLSLYKLKKYCYFNSGVFMVGGKEVGDEMIKYINHRLLRMRTAEAVLNFMVAASNVNVFEFSKNFNYNVNRKEKFGYFYHANDGGRDKREMHKIQYNRAREMVKWWT